MTSIVDMRRSLLVVIPACLFVAACGTRLDDSAFTPTTNVVDIASGDSSVTVDAGASDVGASAADSRGPSGPATTAAPNSGPASTGNGEVAGPAAPTEDAADDDAGAAPNQASDVGVTETTIRIGNITAENGVLGDTFAPAVQGLRAWAAHTNANGGINGRQIELFTCDDREDRARTLECARRLVEQDQVFALVATNTRSMGGASQYLFEQGIPAFGFAINNAFARYPNFFTIYGTGYPRDGKSVGLDGRLVSRTGAYRWYRENLGVDKAAVFAYDIAESAQAGDATAEGLRAEGFEVTQYVVSFAAPSFDQGVADMQRRGTQIVFDAMDDGANRRLCDSMARRGYEPVAKVSTVVILGERVGENYNDTCRNKIFVGTDSRPYSSDEPGVVEFRQAFARYQPGVTLHQWALEAWAAGNVTRDALEAMGPTPTRTGFIDFLNTMEPNTGGGILRGVDFRPSSYDYTSPRAEHCIVVNRWLDSEGGWVRASDPFPTCIPDAKKVESTAREQGD